MASPSVSFVSFPGYFQSSFYLPSSSQTSSLNDDCPRSSSHLPSSTTCSSQPALILTAESLVKEHMARYDPSHDWHHGMSPIFLSSTGPSWPGKANQRRASSPLRPLPLPPVDRVRRTALALARSLPTSSSSPQPDMLVLELAALFHDMNDAKYSLSTSGEPVTTDSILEPFFTSPEAAQIVSSAQRAEICRVVDSVSWSKEKKLREKGEWDDGWRPTSVELACVQDADRLDAIGGFGKSLFILPP